MRQTRVLYVFVALLLVAGTAALGQGIPTSNLSGKVFNEGVGLPGVSVVAKSPALQGTRTTVTGGAGDYVFVNMPPGDYTIAYSLSGFQPLSKTIKLAASQNSQLDAKLSLTAVAAEATVVGKAETISQTSQAATTYSGELLAKLPTARTVTQAVLLSPGLNNSGPNGVSVAGSTSVENLYMVNGVVIQDNVRSTPFNLFVEDAIQETTTATSSISAEYGRFMGGVINTITKSGGNSFSGSLRATFTNDSWNSTSSYRTAAGVNPQEGAFINKVVPTYEATVGGPILKDALWFFLAGRYFDTTSATTAVTGYTGISFTSGTKESRYEGKLTGSPAQGHTLTASYLAIDTQSIGYAYQTPGTVLDLASVIDRQLPQNLFALNYNGVLTNSFFVEAQYSKRKFTFENSGSQFTDPVGGTLLLDRSRANARYNSPTFCGVCGPEKRDNDNYLVKGTYFLQTTGAGSHNIVGGYDDYGGQRFSNNHQSGSDWRIYTTGAIIGSDNTLYPVLTPTAAGTSTRVWWTPILQGTVGTDTRTRSAYVNDTIRLSNRLSLNVGLRYDKNHAQNSDGAVTSNDSGVSPRLAATFDLKGDGKLKFTASYAKYIAGIQDSQAGSSAAGGNPATFYFAYGTGAPNINPDPTKPLLSIADSLNSVWSWVRSQGCDPDNAKMQAAMLSGACKMSQYASAYIPGVTGVIQGSLASPYANEYVLGAGGTIGNRGSFRADLVRREFKQFYDFKLDTTTGQVKAYGYTYDVGQVVNSNDYRREYTGLHTQFAYRLTDRLNVGGIWTWSHLIGDLVGENSASGSIQGTLHSYAEYFDRSWASPVGSLSSDQRHRVRLYGTYDIPIPQKAGALNASVMQWYETGLPYGAVGTIDTNAYVKNPGYAVPTTLTPYYFTARDAYRTEDVFRTDLGLTYSFKVGSAVEIYLAPQVFNFFNAQHVSTPGTTVNTYNNSAANYNAFNPFTTAPVECPQTTTASACKALGANWQKASTFGQATATTSYQAPRWFQFSVGVRF